MNLFKLNRLKRLNFAGLKIRKKSVTAREIYFSIVLGLEYVSVTVAWECLNGHVLGKLPPTPYLVK